jgi:DNA-binding IclR family transcriptional regulator
MAGVPGDWTFLSNHAHVLLAAAAHPDARTDELAATVGITRRATLSILKDLEEAGYLTRTRVGRRTHYTITPNRPFRHPTAAHRHVDELLAIFGAEPSRNRS